ncbi:uncharacterized protein IWZ02DRAFT_488047 [Phyllosticta citriasiana]|uniref:uncharacterized protein n=1 Tax=Phyllosticta citriasiana TaxID=595635 RepID=UPI0030FDD57B
MDFERDLWGMRDYAVAAIFVWFLAAVVVHFADPDVPAPPTRPQQPVPEPRRPRTSTDIMRESHAISHFRRSLAVDGAPPADECAVYSESNESGEESSDGASR